MENDSCCTRIDTKINALNVWCSDCVLKLSVFLQISPELKMQS